MLPLLPCDIEDRYTIVAEIGHGSHAIVYRAIDRHLDREVAIKVLRSELVDSDVNEGFRREIRLTSRLEHPHIAHVYGTGEFMGSPFFVTALARGMSLSERLERERQLPIDEALGIARDIASALAHAHRAGIIHRDVKPANILLTPDGALLTDFGVARALDLSPGTLATSTGVAVGTLLYMSPEQLCAEKGIDGRSDQYALALVVYEMLAGVAPHVAANAEGLRALRITGQHVPVRTLRPGVPAYVDDALQRAMDPTPADRWRDMEEFADELSGGMDAASARRRSTRTRAVTPERPIAAPARRKAAAGALVIALTGSGGFALMQYLRAGPDASAHAASPVASFAVVPVGDALATATAQALASELAAWPDVDAQLVPPDRRAAGTVLQVRIVAFRGVRKATVTLRDAARAAAPARAVQVQFPDDSTFDADSLRLLAARVLMAQQVAPDSMPALDAVVERPSAALRLYGRGWSALLGGDLADAERQFGDASLTGRIPQALLWRVVVASWRRPREPGSWRDHARAYSEIASTLSVSDSLVAMALLHRATDRMADACDTFTRATRIDGGSFAAWYGLGDCLQLDSAVVPDRSSPTGVRFRSSYWGALRAFGESVVRVPSANLTPLFSRLPRVAMAMNPSRRTGTLDGRNGERYAGLPRVEGDSIVVFPVPERVIASGGATTVPSTYQAAIRLGRAQLLRITAQLADRAPRDVAAQLALVRALEYAGVLTSPASERSALTVLQQVRSMARSRRDSLDIGLADARVRLRLGDFRGVRAVAAQLLQSSTAASAEEAGQVAPLAFLVGRSALAETLLTQERRLSPSNAAGLPDDVASAVARYTVGAADGRCRELDALRAAAHDALAAHLARSELIATEVQLLSQGDWLRLVCPGAPVPIGAVASDPLLRATAALGRNAVGDVQAILRSMAEGREGAASSSIAWDTRYAEIWLRLQSKDSTGARRDLARAMHELASSMDFVLLDLRQAAGLRRTLSTCDRLVWPLQERVTAQQCRDALQELSMVE